MATFLATADQSSSVANTQLFTLAATDELLVGREATLSVTGDLSEVVDAGTDTRMIINGELLSAFVAIRADQGSIIQVGDVGSVSATGTALALDDAGYTITNAGEIYGASAALNISNGDSFVTNTGSMTGGTAMRFFDGSNDIVNHGTVHADFDNGNAIFIDGGGNDIENTGTLSAVDGPAINIVDNFAALGGSNDIVNSGTITTNSGGDAIEIESDDSTDVINTGLISGSIDFGAGFDFLDTRKGTVTGDVFGDDGDDTMFGSSADEDFNGQNDDDDLRGFGGNDTLDGDAGDDVLNGGLGLDDLDGDSGFDVASYANSAGAVTAFLAAAHLNTGAEAAGDSYEEIEGLRGSRFNDRLTGDAGANALDGNAGSDTLVGGAGDDVYTIDLATDQIVESAAAGGGVDTVRSSVSFTLAAGLENLQLLGSAAVNGVGNAGANSLTGNFQANVLNGSLGNDTLTGGGGTDTFAFSTALSAANVDTIEDFNVVQDTIRLDNAVFAGLPAGPLAAGAFAVGAAATQADDRVVYNNVTGALIFDGNGSAAGGAVQFATLDPGLALTAADILVV